MRFIAASFTQIDTTFTWHGPHPWVRLDPASQPAHLLHLRQP